MQDKPRLPSAEALVDFVTDAGFSIVPWFLNWQTDHRRVGVESEFKETILYAYLLEYFEPAASRWLARLHSGCIPDWHVIEYDTTTGCLGDGEILQRAVSLQHALAHLLWKIDELRFKPIDIQTNGDGISVSGANGVSAAIYRPQIADVSLELRKRAGKVCERLNLYAADDNADVLRKIHGLEHCQPDKQHSSEEDASQQRVYPLCQNCAVPSARAFAHSMARLLQLVLIESPPLSFTQEATARYLGFASWNHLRALEKKNESSVEEIVLIARQDVSPEERCQVIGVYNGYPDALTEYGKLLLKEDHDTYRVSSWMGSLTLDSNPEELLPVKPITLKHHYNSGLYLQNIDEVDPDDRYVELAAQMLGNEDRVRSLREFSAADADPRLRLLAINQRLGITKEDHLFVKDWAFYVKRGDNRTDHTLIFEQLSNIDAGFSARKGAPLYKAAFIEKPTGYWLADDWSREPIHHIKGLTRTDVLRVEEKLIAEENRMASTRRR